MVLPPAMLTSSSANLKVRPESWKAPMTSPASAVTTAMSRSILPVPSTLSRMLLKSDAFLFAARRRETSRPPRPCRLCRLPKRRTSGCKPARKWNQKHPASFDHLAELGNLAFPACPRGQLGGFQIDLGEQGKHSKDKPGSPQRGQLRRRIYLKTRPSETPPRP